MQYTTKVYRLVSFCCFTRGMTDTDSLPDNIDPSLLEAGSTVVFYSTSPDKIENYRRLFAYYNVNFYTLDELGIPPTKTPEANSKYDDHVQEKGHEFLKIMQAPSADDPDGPSVLSKVQQVLKERGIDESKIVGMAEDSGMSIIAETPAEKKAVEFMKAELRKRIIQNGDPKKENYEALFQGFKDETTGFPGPDLKPIVEALKGGIFELVDIIHKGQEHAGLEYLRYQNETSAALIDPVKKTVSKTQERHEEGRFITPKQWKEVLEQNQDKPGVSITYDDLFYLYNTNGKPITDKQGRVKNRSMLIADGSLYNPKSKIADYRTLNVKNLGFPLGVDKKFINEIPAEFAVLHGEKFHNIEPKHDPKEIPRNSTRPYTQVPSYDELLKNPNLKPIAATNAVILQPHIVDEERIKRLSERKSQALTTRDSYTFKDKEGVEKKIKDQYERHDADYRDLKAKIFEEYRKPLENNIQILLLAVVAKLIHPESKNTGIIIDNRDGHFDAALRMFDETYFNGLAQGTSPIKIANTDEELIQLQNEAEERYKYNLGRSINEDTTNPYEGKMGEDPILNFSLPDNFSIFIGGGAFNNAPDYTRRTGDLAQYIASKDWTLVTGGGQLDGPMGAAHAGFLEYHLSRDKLDALLEDDFLTEEEKEQLKEYIFTREDKILESDQPPFQSLNIEKMLKGKESEELLYKIADNKDYIPKDRFYAFSMEFLIKQEGSGKPTAGTKEGENYHDAGNIIRRMHAMLKANTHVYAPGAHGTAQELIQSLIMNRIEPDPEKRKDIIIYNRKDPLTGRGVFDHVIDELKLHDPVVQKERNVIIVNHSKDAREEVEKSYKRWHEKSLFAERGQDKDMSLAS